MCLLYAIALRRLGSGHARILAVVIITLGSLVSYVRPYDDFRAAALAVNEFVARDGSTPILFASGLIEAQDEGWLGDPANFEYLNAAASYYPLNGRVVTLPRQVYRHPFTSTIVEPALASNERFVAIEWTGNGAQAIDWLSQLAMHAGYRATNRSFGGPRVAFFNFSGDRDP